jgi:hypothetical protein
VIRLTLFFLLISFSSWADIALDLTFSEDTIQQGRLTLAKLNYVSTSTDEIDIKSLEGQTHQQTLYIHEIDLIVKTAQVVFAKVPKDPVILTSLNGIPVRITWNKTKILPTTSQPGFVFGDFEIPTPARILAWVLALAILVTGLVFGIKFLKSWRLRQKLRSEKAKIMAETLACQDYDEVVLLWRRKLNLVQIFPELQGPFGRLEQVLYRYQFKPLQTEHEKKEVMRAYDRFKVEIEGEQNGI